MQNIINFVKQVDNAVNKKIPKGSSKIPSQVDIACEYIPFAYLAISNIFLEKNTDKSKGCFTKAALSYITSTILLTALKHKINRRRPDSLFDYKSFRSRHTANSFNGAHNLYLQNSSFNIATSTCYIIAATTAALRLQRKKHWLSDLLAGAAIGIISAKVGKVIHEKINAD